MRISFQKINNEIDKLKSSLQYMTEPSLECDLKKYYLRIKDLHSENEIDYKPYAIPLEFHKSKAMVKLIMGAYGSGKSSACCAEIIFQAIKMKPDNRNIRRSKWAIIRNTAAELQTTSLKNWQEWATNLGNEVRHVDPVLRYEYQFNDGNGIVELEVMFLALDRPIDVKRLRSLQITGAWCNELFEVNKEVFDNLFDRTGRYPPVEDRSKIDFWYGIIADTNPCDMEHWIYKYFEEKLWQKYFKQIHIKSDYPLSEYAIFHQPPALLEKDGDYVVNPKAENIKHLPGGDGSYYLRAAVGKSKEYIKVYYMGEYGISFDGELVFKEFNPDIHCKDEIEANPEWPLILTWDFGLTPSCLIMQFIDGVLICLKEFATEENLKSGLRRLAENKVIPYLNNNFEGFEIEISLGDPASLKKGAETDESTCYGILDELGLGTDSADTNSIVKRLDAVKWFLNRLIDGKAAFLLSNKGCPMLKKAFLQKYYFKSIKRIGLEQVSDEPIKLHPFSDIMDCLEYGAMYCQGVMKESESNLKDYNLETEDLTGW